MAFDWNEFYAIFDNRMKKECPGCKVGRYIVPKPSDFPYCDFALTDISGGNYDLSGNEGTVNPMITVSVYDAGSMANANCEKNSAKAKKIMLSYGFQCRSGPIHVTNAADPSICRWVARYQRVVGAGDKLKSLN